MNTPEPATPYRTLPAAHLGDPTAPLRWLLTDLFLVGAAGILGGAPKTGKSFFALELAVAVASATAAAGRFVVAAPGPVLLCAAEDPPAVVLQRLAALAAARHQALAALPVQVIVELRVISVVDGTVGEEIEGTRGFVVRAGLTPAPVG